MFFGKLHNFLVVILKFGFVHPSFRIPAMMLFGVFCGMGLLLAHIARTTTYVIDSPDTCMNCHVMTDAYVSHTHSSHGRDVTCNDCHIPHTSVAREYTFKAIDGLKHAAVFTLGIEPQVSHLSSMAVPVVQENCIRCHENRVSETSSVDFHADGHRCWDCHRDNVHGRVRSLSASPAVSRPSLPSIWTFPPMPSASDLPAPLRDWFGKQDNASQSNISYPIENSSSDFVADEE